MRASDGKSADVGVLSAGGFANKATHDVFCSKLDCVISKGSSSVVAVVLSVSILVSKPCCLTPSLVYDQSPQNNHLGQRHKLVNASRHAITVGKDKTPVYGMWFDPGVSVGGLLKHTLTPTFVLPHSSLVWLPCGQNNRHCHWERSRIYLRRDERQELQRCLLL